jgi:geranylgeranyl pyrophosphate synthase
MIVTTDPGVFAPVQAELATVEAHLRQVVAGQHAVLTAATERLLNAGGKRIRPALALLAAKVVGAERRASVALAAAVEMLHTATLVHDDLIDGSLRRRGVATLNAGWSPHAVVLAGDYLFARAAVFAAQTGCPPAIERFADTLMAIVNGEIGQHIDRRVGRAAYFERIHAKTAALFALATEAAAILGGCNEADVRALAAFGGDLGIAYQIVDDILDIVGDPAEMGKPRGSDLRQGLFTLPVLLYLETHPDDVDLKTLLDGNEIDGHRIRRVLTAVCESGAVDRARQEAAAYAERARLALSRFCDSEYLKSMAAISYHAVERLF